LGTNSRRPINGCAMPGLGTVTVGTLGLIAGGVGLTKGPVGLNVGCVGLMVGLNTGTVGLTIGVPGLPIGNLGLTVRGPCGGLNRGWICRTGLGTTRAGGALGFLPGFAKAGGPAKVGTAVAVATARKKIWQMHRMASVPRGGRRPEEGRPSSRRGFERTGGRSVTAICA
jgi:hypothetical protein